MGEHLTESDIKELTSNIIYHNFEHGDGNCNQVPFYDNILYELEMHNSLKPIYDKLAKAVCYVYWRKVNHKNFDSDLCAYLFYWLGDQIYSIVSEKAVFSKIIKAFYGELYASHEGTICNPPEYSIDPDTFHKNKLLFDYSKNYNNIYLRTLSGDTKCDEGYIKYIKKYIETYNDAYLNCNKGDKQKYDCEYFNTLFQNHEKRKLGSFHCTHHKAQPLSTYAQSFDEQVKHLSQVSRVSERNIDIIVNPGLRGDNALHERQGPYKNPGLSDNNVLDSTITHNTNNTSEGGTSKTIAGSVAPVLGVSSISLLLYKVTPLGGFIRNFLGRNRNMYNPVEYMDSFNPYSDGMVPGDRTMNISYHRL
ncbi:Plasmodium vivax Vir protein, putative [Plasmodium vivax]|uniref:Vir protein, putative n=1 Tax=Plasmodium vivax TaxID=5855 RepID=A0A1G4EEA0_PLAVI|nr:Plasmodium vivax Vir protein, putative [Plasmodium vivax]SCA60687.1 Plasmodium vivax Vir protein, putative [Plasmodium vivax]